jgi:ABC-type uncharacterized transport system permease subunit
LLSDIPGGLGGAFQNLSPVVIFAAVLVFPVSYALYRTRWGLRLRSAGENPEATRSLGVAVGPLRWQGVLLSGTLAGLAGGFLSVEVVGNWREGQTLGLGFISLAALILRLDDAPIISALPDQFINMIPYVVTIVAIAGFVGRVRPPAAAGRAYEGAGGT